MLDPFRAFCAQLQIPSKDRGLFNRFFSKVEPEPNSGCWIWIGAQGRRGYGRFRGLNRGDFVEPHVFSYRVLVGDIPPGLELDHRCRQPWCVNPGHLEAVTHKENVRRGNGGINNRIKRACPRGHLYDYVVRKPGGKFSRSCRRCHRQHMRTYRARKAEHVSSG